jgi:ABC-type phosphate/phosphonate transport system substrate-binding protein
MNSKNKPTVSMVLAVLVLCSSIIGLLNYVSFRKHTKDISVLKEKNLSLETELMNSNSSIKKLNRELQVTKMMIPPKTAGAFYVTATELNVRIQPSTDNESIGTVAYGTKIDVIDTSNPLWYKLRINTSGFQLKKESNITLLLSGQGKAFTFKNSFIDDNKLKNGDTYYVSSKYVTERVVIAPANDVPKGEKPFTYGILFYDDATKLLLEKAIWDKMKGKLMELGYTGVNVTPVNRKTLVEDIRKGTFDAVESASGQFAEANRGNRFMEVFAKNVIDDSTSYSGIVLVNKNSGITDFSSLKGKKVLAYNKESESGFRYQRSLLRDEGIDVEKDLKLEMGDYHQVIFYKVAKGQADAGFVGDFIMTDSYEKMKESLQKSKIEITKGEFEDLKANILALTFKGAKPIPNNPHAVKENIFKDREMVKALFDCVKQIYQTNKENYDIVDAVSKEYEFLLDN